LNQVETLASSLEAGMTETPLPGAEGVFSLAQLKAFLVALGIGLLIGLERERVASAKAGVRTFGLVALLGALATFLSQLLGSAAPLVAGLILTGAILVAAHTRHPDPQDPATTSEVALMVCYCLGAMVWFGHVRLAVMLAVVITVLLYFKTKLEGLATRLTPQDWTSILQFAVLSLVILPILPDQDYGPYAALNPHQVWLMVVLVSGISLAGYMALQLVGSRYGAPLVGLMGGLVSSTATTLVYARNARTTASLAPMAAMVILLANLVMVLRVTVIAAAVAPALVKSLLVLVAPGLALGTLAALLRFGRRGAAAEVPLPSAGNPTELRTALGFGLLYALVLSAAAWLSDLAGQQGLYVVALVSGLTDVDAITLSSLRLYNLGKLSSPVTVTAVGLGMLANLAFKTGLAVTIGGWVVSRGVLAGMGAVGAGLGLGLAAQYWAGV
jgi:uncharacterized membrane protein (DUF4010 family)